MVINIKNVLLLKEFPVLELGYTEQGDSTKWGLGIRDKSIIHVITKGEIKFTHSYLFHNTW